MITINKYDDIPAKLLYFSKILSTKNFEIMLKTTKILLPIAILFILIGCTTSAKKENNSEPALNKLTKAEKEQGWILLFDGETFNGWRGLGRDAVPEAHWVIEDDAIHKVESGEVPVQADGQPLEGGDLMTIEAFRDFEFKFEWKISLGGNSGIKYNVSEELSTRGGPSHAALGFEYQLLDDVNHSDNQNITHLTASLYDMIPAINAPVKPVGEFNTGRIVFNGNHGEHWVNGVKVVDYDLGTARFDTLFQHSKYVRNPDFPEKRAGHIVLQDHSDEIWFRNIKIRKF